MNQQTKDILFLTDKSKGMLQAVTEAVVIRSPSGAAIALHIGSHNRVGHNGTQLNSNCSKSRTLSPNQRSILA